MSFEDEDFDKAPSFDAALWRRLLRHAWPYRMKLVQLGASGAALACIDTLLPYLAGRMVDVATAATGAGQASFDRELAWLVAAYVAGLTALAVLIWVFIRIAGIVATGVAHDLRRAGFGRLQELPFSFYDTRATGWLVARLTSDCEKVADLLPWFLIDVVWGPCLIVFITIMMFVLDTTLALTVLVIVPPLALLSAAFQRLLLESSRHVRRTASRITAEFSEAIAGVRTTKALTREQGNLAEFSELAQTMRSQSVRNALQSALYLPLVTAIGSVGIGLALWRGGIELSGDLTIGSLVTFMQYATLFSMPIQDLARQFTAVQAAQAAAERVQGLLETEPEIADDEHVQARLRAHADARPHGIAIDGHPERIGSIAFDHVGFWYKPGEPVLRDVDFEVRAGQTVALVGPTGGGKSTIVSLVARFYEAQQGAVRIDGIDVRERSLHWLQSNLGVVLQTPHLFSGTIADNIRYGRLDATEEEIRAAAARVFADRFIDELPNGYATEVGEGGARLSTGQRQLVSLARAVLADPQIFIMDEATSSVDTETEALVQAGIEAVLEGRIAFVIAHRLSTIRNADLILVIEDGHVVERGTHEQLLRAHGRYRELHQHHHARIDDALAGVTT